MASIYYPTTNNVYTRVVGSTGLSELHIDVASNVIFVLTGSFPNTSSLVFVQAMDTASSYPITASYTLAYFASSSYADTASVALNAASAGNSTSSLIPYTTIVTSSTNWITASFSNSTQFITINSGAVYNFTCSNVPSANTASNLSLFINNLATVTCSLAFPSDWVFIGSVPSYLSSSKSAVLSLMNFGGTKNVAAWGAQY